MTVVGAVELEVRAVVDQGVITRQINDQLRTPMRNAGTSAGKVMGQHVGESAAAELEKSGARFARSGRLLSNVFTANSASALGPLQEVADKVNLIGSTLDSTRTKAGGLLLGIGAATTGVGAFLSTLASREQGASNRLAASIAATGGSIDDYRERIDEAVKSGEKFGYSGNQTIDALQALTIGLHDPKKALDELGTTFNIAATRQVGLGSAANIVRQAYNGNTRVLKAFGIQVSGIIDGQKLLKDAHEKAGKAASDAAKAQHDYDEKLAIYRDTLKPTLSQQLALRDAHDKLLTAQHEQIVAQHEQTVAQGKANAAGAKGQQVLDQLAKVTAGQASASANTFTGHLKAIGATIEDNAAKVGGKAGKVLIEFGPALAAGGFLIESGLLPKIGRGVLGLIGLGTQSVATATEIATTSATEVASLDTVVAAVRELQIALTGIGPAAAEGAAGLGTATATMDAELAATSTRATGLIGILRGIGGLGGVTLGIVGAGIGVAIKEAVDTDRLTGSLDAQAKALSAAVSGSTGKDQAAAIQAEITRAKQLGVVVDKQGRIIELNPTGKNANQRSAGEAILRDALAAQKKIADAKINAEQKGLVDDANAERKAQQHGRSLATAVNKGAASVKPQSLTDFLNQNGLGPVANAALDKQLSDAQKAAGARARQIGSAVTAGIRAQVATVKHEISGLNDQLKKIADFRAQVVAQAASFTSVGGLLSDPSLATASGLVSGEVQRNAALKLFGANITNLRRRHLDPGEIADILSQGPEGGRQIAAALAQGSDTQIAQLNFALTAGRQQAQILAGQAVDAKFGAGAQARLVAEASQTNRRLAHLEALIAAQPAATGKAVAQAEKNAKVSQTSKTRTAVTR